METADMTNQIKYMAERFLQWRLPDDFRPDAGISFDPVINKGTPHEHRYRPFGTNLLGYTQAEDMVRFMLDGLPAAPPPPRVEVTEEMVEAACEAARRESSTPETWGEKIRARMRAALEAALSTQDQAQGGSRSADTQPPGAQVEPAASAPTPPDDDQMSDIIKRAAAAAGPHESSVQAACNAIWRHGYDAAQPVRPRVTVEDLAPLIWDGLMDNGREPCTSDARTTARAILKLFGEE